MHGTAYAEESSNTFGAAADSGMMEITASEASADSTATESSGETQSAEADSSQQSSTQAEDTTQTAEEQNSKGEVARAQFTTAIQDREPTDDVVTLSNNTDKVYFFTDLINFKGTTVTHRWEFQGEVMAEVNFNVGGDRWRIYSSKNLKPDWIGIWSVTVLNEEGKQLKVSSFELVTADSNQQ